MIKPIFIFSLPRSGSTLLQRVLMSHSKISSTAEPWLLLPLLQMLKKEGALTNFSHQICQMAIEDMVRNMRGGRSEYNQFLREFIESVYNSASREGSTYFLDKTPRYYMIIPEIVELFPDAKFIFLFRNPVHVYASIITTWGGGGLSQLFHITFDLDEGPTLLSNGYALIKEKSYAMQYEEFVKDPPKQLAAILSYLELEFEESMLSSFAKQRPKGRMGDPTGVKLYSSVDTRSLEKWKTIFNNRFRKRLLRNYILGLPESTLAVQGYDRKHIVEEIDNLDVAQITPLKDYFDYFRSVAVLYFRPYLFFAKEMKWSIGRHLS